MVHEKHEKRSARPVMRIQAGLTLIELMIAMVLGLLVVLAATALLVSTKSGYIAQDDDVRLQETGRYAIEIISRTVRQAGYENWDSMEAPVLATVSFGANFSGWDAHRLNAKTEGIDSPIAKSINGSDVLAVRFFGSGSGKDGDGVMVNCAGFSVAAAASVETADKSRGWSIFYVAENSSGEPELYCKYPGDKSWSSQAIAHGVESFQVLYGVDTDEDGLANQFLTATTINAWDDALAFASTAEKNSKTYWKKVVAVKVALLVRGMHRTRDEKAGTEYALFGNDYAAVYAASDPGVHIKEAALPKSVRGRERRIFTTTIQLRKHAVGSSV